MGSIERRAMHELGPFLMHWGITSIALWVASQVFRGVRFDGTSSLLVAALLLGLANAIVKPLLIVLTLPLTFVTFGLFLLVINALMILLVSAMVRGFQVSTFWTALWASIFVSTISFVLEVFFLGGGRAHEIQMPHSGVWL